MKNFALENYGVAELNVIESNEIVGGYSWNEFKKDVSDFFSGLSDGFSNPSK